MSRRRYISTEITVDKQVNKMGMQYGDGPVLLYTWMIPHAADDATITGDPFELLNLVWPGRRDKTEDDVIGALEAMETFDLILWDREHAMIYLPVNSFYRYQTYIKADNRRKTDPDFLDDQRPAAENTDDQRKTPTISEEQRATAENAVSPSPSPSLSPSPKKISNNNRAREDEGPSLTQSIVALWERHGFGLASGFIVDTLINGYLVPKTADVPALPWDVMVLAFEEAERHNVRTLAYVQKILDRWRAQGWLTAATVQERLASFQARKGRSGADPPGIETLPGIRPSENPEYDWILTQGREEESYVKRNG